MELESFLKDVVNVEKDPGERWLLGYRKRIKPKTSGVKPETSGKKTPSGVKGPAKSSKKKKVEEEDKIGIYLLLRRCPGDVNRDMGNLYRSEREKKDAFGNAVQDFYFTPENFEAFLNEKARWMFINTENFFVEIDKDPETVAMYDRAFFPTGVVEGQGIKPEAKLQLDGHWNDELRTHYINRYKWIRNEILKANAKYEAVESVKDEFLRGN